jgi:N-acetylglucosaminyldiphosphoundecaprenol N-acetyl-beta-D-mannosaminyltransferase
VTRRPLFGAHICSLTRKDLVSAIVREPATDGVRLVVTMNLDHVVRLRSIPAFRRAYAGAWAATIDGAPVFLYARARGAGAPERITGPDLLADLIQSWPRDRRPFFMAASHETGQRLIEHCVARGFPRDSLAYQCPPFGFESDITQSETLCREIRAHGTTDLVAGVGSPKSEVWIDVHRNQLGVLYAYALGASLEFLTGRAARAPKILRAIGLEWTWRLGREPGRLWRRYLVDSWAVFPSVAEDLAGRAPHGALRLED